MRELVVPLAFGAFMLFLVSLIPGVTLRAFNPLSFRRTGRQFGMSPLRVLAVVQIGQLALDLSALGSRSDQSGSWIAMLAIALVVLTVAVPNLADALLGIAGVVATVALLTQQGRSTEVVALVALAVLLVWLLGLVRGLVRAP